ncbi:NAD-dependent epimerase/dehydratase family protein [Natrinema sp. CGMCC1.2065]|uniref:NAD-dependent epimerase/dehydratase family protein n=1 Tax=Natrinema sp. CGMCC1.2065 TaxID=3445767 RepID=UPI003F4A3962
MSSGDKVPHAIVTGGAGFLGSHLVDELREDGYRVTVIDHFGSGRSANLHGHRNDPLVDIVDYDIRNPLPDFDRVDQIYHLASRASPADFESHAVEIALTNSMGTRNVFDLARRHDARTILASTSEVYGDPEENPQKETYNGNVNVRGPRAPYDESKRFAEALAVAYRQQHSTDIRTVRIFNTYGPRMRSDDGRVIPNFLSQALNDRDLTVYGDGSQTRSFCYVADLIDGIRTFGELPPSEGSGAVVNLGSTHEITIMELAETVLEMTDSDVGITYEPLPTDDPQVRRPDISKAKDLLGWEATTDLETGLRKTLSHWETEADAEPGRRKAIESLED